MADQTETKPQTREEILASSLTAREAEVMHYQINIDNYTLALEQISKLPPDERLELSAFTEQLNTLFASEKIEQKKAKIMLAVIKQQVG
tara:strand:+ start:450 stop:716 length:267 start_codon:yes stop_codon:yes gene_type:complete